MRQLCFFIVLGVWCIRAPGCIDGRADWLEHNAYLSYGLGKEQDSCLES